MAEIQSASSMGEQPKHHMSDRSIPLHSGWKWKQRTEGLSLAEDFADTSAWTGCTSFPSEVHVELMRAGRICDPYISFGEHEVQWVGDEEWLYKTNDLPLDVLTNDMEAVLEFEGLDTVCDIYFNGRMLLHTENMFRRHKVPLPRSDFLQAGINELALHFHSAKRLALSLESQHGPVRAGSTNLGHPSRVYVRKAQYDWRWDWGPELMTVGPYRPVSLHIYQIRIEDLHVQAEVVADLQPVLSVGLDLTGNQDLMGSVRVAVKALDGNVVKSETIFLDSEINTSELLRWDLQGLVDLWYPVGYGSQTRYTVSVTLLSRSETPLSIVEKTVGFRCVQLVQEPLIHADRYGKGRSFFFRVNGVPIFVGGANWVPADNFLTVVDEPRIRAWLKLMRDGNMNMVRIWGGGVYEPDIFYDICDELGILVWQDFQFACGVYPAHSSFVKEVAQEAEDVVCRIRHHPCLALFCGNNEDYQMVHQWPDVPRLPARKIYEDVLPSAVSRFTRNTIPYHPGSPYAEGCLTVLPDGREVCDTADPTQGDVHQWDIWGGKERPWQEYDVRGGRFVSEFGIPSIPSLATVDNYYFDESTPEEDKYPQSKSLAQHCRAGAFERRFAIVLYENVRFTNDLETYIFNTQLIQSEAMAHAYRSWRREWRGLGKEYCSGVLVWQINDCWPVTSWAVVDYFLRPKPAYYAIARELNTISVGVSRTVNQNRANDRPRQFYEFGATRTLSATLDVWATNSSLSSQTAILELSFIDLASEWTHKETHEVVLAPNSSTELLSGVLCLCPPGTNSSTVVVGARLTSIKDKKTVLARTADWPQPYKHLSLPPAHLEIIVRDEEVCISAERPIKCLVLSVDDDGLRNEGLTCTRWQAEGVKWSDNALDIMPGDEQVVKVKGLGRRRVKVSYLGCEKAVVI